MEMVKELEAGLASRIGRSDRARNGALGSALGAAIPAAQGTRVDSLAGETGVRPGNGWLPASENLRLSRDGIHVWRASLNLAVLHIQDLRQTLTADEANRADRIVSAQDRKRFIAARGLLRVILGRYLGMRPERLRFRYGPWGKPALIEDRGDELHFNLSHSHDLALYALARDRQVGIDLEYVRPVPEVRQLVERFFSSSERAVFCALPPEMQLGAFFRGWTQKEAFIKARGQGFTFALDRFDVSIAPGEPAGLLNVGGDQGEPSRWSLCELSPALGYVAALAAEGHDWHLSCWEWTE